MIFDKNTDPKVRQNMIETYEKIKARCETQIEAINYKCAFEGEKMSDHKEVFDSLKQSLREANEVLKKARLIEG
tara:strand:- start:4787 stop:5008 length:222 start_codon:yes stop_codon:yes gene_type:complete